MPFTFLLVILSLIILVPIIFVVRSKSHASLNTLQASRQRVTNVQSASVKTAPSFEQLLRYQMPQSFSDILHDLAQDYKSLTHKAIPTDKAFTARKLVEVRVPELVFDYLKLDEHYATKVVVDDAKQLTSQDLVLNQLHSILHFLQKLHNDGNEKVVDSLLANRNYLQSVYGDSGIEKNFIGDNGLDKVGLNKSSLNFEALINETHSKQYAEYGYDYISEFYPNEDTPIASIVFELGRVVFLSDNTVRLAYKSFGKVAQLNHFEYIICESIPTMIDELYELATHATSRQQHLAARLCMQKLDDYVGFIKQLLTKLSDEGLGKQEKLDALMSADRHAKSLVEDNFFQITIE